MGWQIRLRVGASPGPVVSGRRLSGRLSNIPLSLLVLSAGTQLKNECELQRRTTVGLCLLVQGEAASVRRPSTPLTRGTPRCRTRQPH